MKLNTDGSKRLDIEVRSGATLHKAIRVLIVDQPFDFTGYTAVLNIYSKSQTTPIFAFTEAVNGGLTLSNGYITLDKTKEETTKMRNRALYYVLWVTDPTGKRVAWLTGNFIVNEHLSDTENQVSTITINPDSTALTVVFSESSGANGGYRGPWVWAEHSNAFPTDWPNGSWGETVGDRYDDLTPGYVENGRMLLKIATGTGWKIQ